MSILLPDQCAGMKAGPPNRSCTALPRTSSFPHRKTAAAGRWADVALHASKCKTYARCVLPDRKTNVALPLNMYLRTAAQQNARIGRDARRRNGLEVTGHQPPVQYYVLTRKHEGTAAPVRIGVVMVADLDRPLTKHKFR